MCGIKLLAQVRQLTAQMNYFSDSSIATSYKTSTPEKRRSRLSSFLEMYAIVPVTAPIQLAGSLLKSFCRECQVMVLYVLAATGSRSASMRGSCVAVLAAAATATRGKPWWGAAEYLAKCGSSDTMAS